jgi:hypothetical protein
MTDMTSYDQYDFYDLLTGQKLGNKLVLAILAAPINCGWQR